MSNKDKIIEEIIKVEGGYVNDSSDSGGETKYGITIEVAKRYGFKGDMKSLTKKEAAKIYEDMYWNSIRADEINLISESLAYELFDISVNMGVRRAGEFLQRSLNTLNNKQEYFNDMKVDGQIGNTTLSSLKAYARKRFNADGEVVLYNMINCLQGAFYVELVERREKDEKYIFGWMKNRVTVK